MADEIAYRELKAGEVIQPDDEWQTESGRWALFHQSMIGQPLRDYGARRPYNIAQIRREQRDASEAVAIWQRAGQAAMKERDEAKAAMQGTQSECVALRKDRDKLHDSVNELVKRNQFLTAELARLQQPSPADHIADVNKMVESELERMAWELCCRLDLDEEGAFRQAEHFIAERNRRRQVQRENDTIIADVLGDPS